MDGHEVSTGHGRRYSEATAVFRLRALLTTPAGVYILVGIVVTAAYFAVGRGSLVQSLTYDAVALAAGIAVLVGIRLYRPRRRTAWALLAAGQLAFAAGDIAFDVYDHIVGREPPVPSVADVFYLGGYPLIACGFVLLILGIGTRRRLAAFAEAGIVTFAFALAQWTFLMAPALRQGGSVAERGVALAYPAADIVLLAGLAAFFVTAAWRTRSYQLLVASMLFLVAADELYGTAVESYAAGDWVDAGWLVAYVLWAAAALHPSMARLGEPGGGLGRGVGAMRIGLLAAALLTAPTILLVQRLRGAPLEVAATAAAAGAISLLVVARLTGVVRALERIRGRERAARAQVEAANAKLIEADRLKDEFVALISHDLRTPLTSIMGFLELALDEQSGSLSAEQRSYLEVVSRNSQRLLHLVDDLLFAARLQSGALDLRIDELDLAAMAEHALEEARPRAEAKQIVLLAETEAVPPVLGDRGRVAQLLDNLVSNAVKFTPDGGTVTVAVGSTRERVLVEVRDTGIGIPPEEVERLFDRFFRASTAVDRQISGSGLGLYIARAIVEAHNGAISVRSAIGRGTTFHVELPVFVAAEPRGRVAQRQSGGT